MKPFRVLLLITIALVALPRSAVGTRVLIGLCGGPLLPEMVHTAVAGELEKAFGWIEYEYKFIDVLLAEVPEDALEGLAASPYVRFIERDSEVTAPEPLGEEGLKLTVEWLPWGVDRIDAEAVHHPPRELLALLFLPLLGLIRGRGRHRLLLASCVVAGLAFPLAGCDLIYIRVHPGTRGPQGAGVKVALLDSGIDPDHLDLRANYRGGYDFVNGDPFPWDDNGHGTEVAGVLAARENGLGLVGVAPRAELFAVKVLGSDARGAISDVARGLEWAIDHGIQVVNMSLGTPEDSPTLREAVRAAWEAGLVLIAPVGNESGRVLYPAAYDEVIAVAATDRDDRLAWFSNTGPEVELVAPGEEVPTTYPGGRYRLASGTSFAAPHVAGVAALLISAGVKDNQEIRVRLDETAEDLGLPRGEEGFGLVDAARAVLGESLGDDLVAAGRKARYNSIRR